MHLLAMYAPGTIFFLPEHTLRIDAFTRPFLWLSHNNSAIINHKIIIFIGNHN